MSEPQGDPVRPTKRCLDDLDLRFPPLEQDLHALDHPVISHAQRVPAQVAAQGVERVKSIDDRIWFKVKTGFYRAAVHELSRSRKKRDEIVAAGAWWWIGAAGVRKDDSGSDDFYAQLEAECKQAGKGTGRASSGHLLPADIDLQRLEAELAAQTVVQIKRLVCDLIARSIRDGQLWSAQTDRYEISALVRAKDDEAYIAVITEGFIDPNFMAMILGAVPGVKSSDWLAEPGGALGITPSFGQIVYSAMIPPEYQAKIVDQCG